MQICIELHDSFSKKARSAQHQAMSSNNTPATANTYASKPGLSVASASGTNPEANQAKFAQKVSGEMPPSNQQSEESPDEARKRALEKQFLISQATIGLGHTPRR
ncbi:hypothetical protein BBJ28_00023248 [Nothophytophthora sp. Chile5]|nr:hypothetical protein BBJ28_00023248 [Nothophytophthora sp. Chile5]